MASFKHLILGGGMVAGHCAKQYVENGGKAGELAIVSGDDALPYERPPLSKGFLAGKDSEESVRINAAEFYAEHGIDVRLNTRVNSIDARGGRLSTSSGEEFGFEKLILATGAEVRRLDVPGAASSNVLYLRSLNDSKRLRDASIKAKHAVVAGGGFIAMEVASVLASRGIETTILARQNRFGAAFFTPEMSAFFEKYYVDRGVRILKQTEVMGIEKGSRALLKDGRAVDFDLFLAGIGVQPVTVLAEKAGLPVDNGILVNEYLETRDANLYAAGDVANYPDSLFGMKRRRVEHWDNAVSQGQYLAGALLGKREPFVHVPYFFSDVFDLSYEFWGDPSPSDRVVHRGDLQTSSFSIWWLSQNRLVAAFAMNRPDEERELAPELIRSRKLLSAERLREAGSVRDAAA
uniref:FAD-dependent pyridine nucleotide-disulphide oxidoreductase n=1 Tax=Solibacter usitatus (strain Ellin6076) TaxID=234267 RepID=Q020J7_SOLUE